MAQVATFWYTSRIIRQLRENHMQAQLYNTKEARDQFNQIINHILATGEEIWITKDKKLAAKIVPIEKKLRQLGLLDNSTEFWIADGFDEPDPNIEALFYGEKE